MGFQEIGSRVRFVSAKNLREDEACIEGWFAGVFESKYGPAYKFLTKTGELVGIRDYAVIRSKIEEGVKLNDYTQIIYEGEYTIKNGSYAGNQGKSFRVLVDKSAPEPDVDSTHSEDNSDDDDDDAFGAEDFRDGNIGDDDLPF